MESKRKHSRGFYIGIVAAAVVLLFSSVLFWHLNPNESTFSGVDEDPAATMAHYAGWWDSTTILHSEDAPPWAEYGEQVATVTIPGLNMYERPVYYGSNGINTNWQITTSGPAGTWGMFGQADAVANMGAHNYQLFTELPSLQPGDKMIVETEVDIYVYEVVGSAIFHAKTDNWTEVAYRNAEPCSVTLMTCYPVDAVNTSDRFLVYTKLVRGTIFSGEPQEGTVLQSETEGTVNGSNFGG